MRRGRLAAFAFAAALCGGAAHAQEAKDNCVGMYDDEGRTVLKAYAGLDLMQDAALPAPPEGKLIGVLCRRDSIIPRITDYRVLGELHVPLDIASGGRVVALEIARGQVRLRVLSGALTPFEAASIKPRLDEVQLRLRSPS